MSMLDNFLDAAPSAVLILGVIPLLWSGLVFALHARGHAQPVASMRLEAALLVLMIAPVLLGLAAFALAPLLPQAALPAVGIEAIGFAIAPAAGDIAPAAAAAPKPASAALDPWPALAAIASLLYFAGLAWSAFRLLHARIRLDRAARAGAPEPRLGDAVRLTDDALPPFASACGAIVLPRALTLRMAAPDLAFVVRHERAHLDRADPASFWTLAWVDALFWFNPFIRRQTARCRLAAEIACDAAVVADAPQRREDYARALIAAVKHAARAPAWVPTIVSNGEQQMRIMQIMSDAPQPRSRRARLALAAAAVLAVPVGGLQLAACAGGAAPAAPPAVLPISGSAALESTVEVTSPDAASVRFEQVDERNFTLTGPLRVRSVTDEFDADRIDFTLYYDLVDQAADPEPTTTGNLRLVLPNGVWAGPDGSGQPEVITLSVCGREMILPAAGTVQAPPCQGSAGAWISAPTNAVLSQANATDAPLVDPTEWAFEVFTAIPLEGRLTSPFGRRIDPNTGREANHTGIDIAAPEGTPIVAAADGEVTFVGWRGGYGRVVELNHGGGFQTRAAQLSEYDVARGEHVSAGQVIGRVGSTGRSTGPHVHWELWYERVIYDPMPMLAELGFTGE